MTLAHKIENNRALFGKKVRYATYIRQEILGGAKELAKKQGIPITRLFENALLSYFEVGSLASRIEADNPTAASADELCTMFANKILNDLSDLADEPEA